MNQCMTTCLSNQVDPAVPLLRELLNSKEEGNLINCWASLIAQLAKNLPAMQETQVQFLFRQDPLKKEMATHSSILVWRIPWAEEPGGLQSMGSQESETT